MKDKPIFKGPISIKTEIHDEQGKITSTQFTFTYEFYGDTESIAGPDGVCQTFNAHATRHPSPETERWMVASIRRELGNHGHDVADHDAYLEAIKEEIGNHEN